MARINITNLYYIYPCHPCNPWFDAVLKTGVLWVLDGDVEISGEAGWRALDAVQQGGMRIVRVGLEYPIEHRAAVRRSRQNVRPAVSVEIRRAHGDADVHA